MLLYNPISGKGRGEAAAADFAKTLRMTGHEAVAAPTMLENPKAWLDPLLAGVDALAVIGGDGAMRLVAPSACRSQTPVYHIPFGTENLFAREYNMRPSPTALLDALSKYSVKSMDVGIANGRMFLLMASIGYDAEVVHDLASRRGASISHWTYLWPVVSQLWRWRAPTLRIAVDDQRIDDDGCGFVVVGNCKQYGWRVNPAGRAACDDGLLDVVYFPCRSRAGLARWALRCRFGRQFACSDLVFKRGARVVIESNAPARYQLDGDPPGEVHELGEPSPEVDAGSGGPLRLEIAIQPGALRVLVP